MICFSTTNNGCLSLKTVCVYTDVYTSNYSIYQFFLYIKLQKELMYLLQTANGMVQQDHKILSNDGTENNPIATGNKNTTNYMDIDAPRKFLKSS